MSDGMRASIEKRAELNGRSMNSEILAMLNSLLNGNKIDTTNTAAAHQERAPYLVEHEEMLLRIYRSMTVEKQLALLSLFK